MKITWILPQNYDIPVGGYKIVYQYANKLISMGHDVRIIFLQNPSYYEKGRFYQLCRSIYWKIFNKNPFKKEVTWFKLNPKIQIDWNIPASRLTFEQDEKIIATAYWTANYANQANIPLKNKFYFLQDYEIFSGSVEDVEDTWQLPLNKFAVSSWLIQFGKTKFDEDIKFVPNFLDEADDFKVTIPVDSRKNTIALLSHSNQRKNTKLGLEIIQDVKKQIPDLKVILFGTGDFDASNIEYVKYFKRPSRKELRDDIYNQAAIYLLPSEYEGWGLTAMEAMASGDIVVSNDNGGVNDFIQNSVNGFILDFSDKSSVVELIVKVMNHRDFSIAINASQVVNDFSVENSTNTLLNFLSSDK